MLADADVDDAPRLGHGVGAGGVGVGVGHQDPVADLGLVGEGGLEAAAQRRLADGVGQPQRRRRLDAVDGVLFQVQVDVLEQVGGRDGVDEVAGRQGDAGAALGVDDDEVASLAGVAVQEEQHFAVDEAAGGVDGAQPLAAPHLGQRFDGARLGPHQRLRRETAAVARRLRRFCKIVATKKTKKSVDVFEKP